MTPMPPASDTAATSSGLLHGYMAPQISGTSMPSWRVTVVSSREMAFGMRAMLARKPVREESPGDWLARIGCHSFSLLAEKRFQVKHHPAGEFVAESREAEALVKPRRGFVDGIRHEEAERDRAATRELESQSEGLLEQV